MWRIDAEYFMFLFRNEIQSGTQSTAMFKLALLALDGEGISIW